MQMEHGASFLVINLVFLYYYSKLLSCLSASVRTIHTHVSLPASLLKAPLDYISASSTQAPPLPESHRARSPAEGAELEGSMIKSCHRKVIQVQWAFLSD